MQDHAWCQMSNDYHVVVETPEGNPKTAFRVESRQILRMLVRCRAKLGHMSKERA